MGFDPVKRTGSLTVAALIMAALLICGPLVLTERVQAASEASFGNARPTSAYANESVTFSIELTNTGEKAFTVGKAEYKIDWGGNNATTVTLSDGMEVAVGRTVNLTGSFITPDVPPATYSGNVTIIAVERILLILEDETELTFKQDFTIVSSPPLTVSVHASPASGTVPLNVTFTSEVEGGVGSYTYAWSTSDGAFGNSSTFEHRFTKPGKYNATLMVTDSRGTTASANITVQAGTTQLVASIGVTTLNGLAPLTIVVSSTVSGGVGPYTYAWTTGDGGTFNGESFTYVYYEPGTYTVRLLVTDAEGSTARDLITVSVLSSTGQTVAPDSGGPLDIGPYLMIYIFVFVVASVSVVGFMIYRNRTRFRR